MLKLMQTPDIRKNYGLEKSLNTETNNFFLIRHKNGVRLLEESNDDSTQAILKNFPENRFNIYLVDNESKAKKFNRKTLETCGFDSFSDISGKTVVDVWGHSESLMRVLDHDREVIETRKMKIAEETVFSGDGIAETALSFKFPWYDESDQCIGLLGCTLLINTSNTTAHINLPEYLNILHHSGLLGNPVNPEGFLPGLNIGKHYLSGREKEVLSLLIKGQSAKKAASILKISPRTVEQHILNMRSKTGTNSKAELIEKAVHILLS